MLAPLAACLAIALGAPTASGVAALSHGTLRPHVDLALRLRGLAPADDPLAGFARAAGTEGPPPCVADVCQPRVSVPGFEPSFRRAHRSELFVLALTRAHVEPIATIAWALASTGLRLDWTPVAMDGPNSGGHGWGSVFLRLRLRLDADNVPVFLPRPR